MYIVSKIENSINRYNHIYIYIAQDYIHTGELGHHEISLEFDFLQLFI